MNEPQIFEHNGLTYTVRPQNILEANLLSAQYVDVANTILKAKGFADGIKTEGVPLVFGNMIYSFVELMQVTTISGKGAYKVNLYRFAEKDIAIFDRWFDEFTEEYELNTKWYQALEASRKPAASTDPLVPKTNAPS